MGETLLNDLRLNETDVDAAIDRLSGNAELYAQILAVFPSDTSMTDLENALDKRDWDSAFTAVHALKGLAANLGFIPLSHSLGEMVILIRSGRISEVNDSFERTKKYYNDIISVINANLK